MKRDVYFRTIMQFKRCFYDQGPDTFCAAINVIYHFLRNSTEFLLLWQVLICLLVRDVRHTQLTYQRVSVIMLAKYK